MEESCRILSLKDSASRGVGVARLAADEGVGDARRVGAARLVTNVGISHFRIGAKNLVAIPLASLHGPVEVEGKE